MAVEPPGTGRRLIVLGPILAALCLLWVGGFVWLLQHEATKHGYLK